MKYETIDVFCDGSCKATDPERVGAYCAVIRLPDGDLDTVCGSQNKTTISLMEIEAVSCSLKYLLLHRDDPRFFPPEIVGIKIFSDSEYVVKCSTKEYKINANQSAWRVFNLLIKDICAPVNGKSLWVEIGHIPRNSLSESAQADFVVDQLRRSSEATMAGLSATKGYYMGTLKRK